MNFTVSLANTSALQNLLTTPGATAQLASINGETIQIIAVSSASDLVQGGKFWQMLPSGNSSEIATVIAVNEEGQTDLQGAGKMFIVLQCEVRFFVNHHVKVVAAFFILFPVGQIESGEGLDVGDSTATQVVDMVPVSGMSDPSSALILPPLQPAPPGCPSWAARLRDCEVSSFASVDAS